MLVDIGVDSISFDPSSAILGRFYIARREAEKKGKTTVKVDETINKIIGKN